MNKKRAAAIDFGSNSSRLLIAEFNNGEINVIYQRLITTRLAKSIDENQILDLESINKTIEAVKSFNEKMKEYNVKKYRTAGTSALRDAKNSDEFVDSLKNKTGINLDIVSGAKEAELTYIGVTFDNKNNESMIIDIGGGSTEFINLVNGVPKAVSLDIGAVRFTERFIDDPSLIISKSDQEMIITETSNYLKNHFKSIKNSNLVGVGGTITTLAAIDKGITHFDPRKIEGYILDKISVNNIINKLSNMKINKRKKVDGLQKDRADIIISGSLILEAIFEFFSVEDIKVSNKDLLYGLIIEIFENEQYYFYK